MNISRYVEEVCNGTWYKFRDQEHESLKKVLTGKSEIISLGGGSIAYDRNRHLIDPVDTYNLSPHLSIQTQK